MSEGGDNKGKGLRRVLLRVMLVLVFAAAVGTSGLLYVKYRHAVDANPKTAEQRAVTRVSSMLEVPAGQPTVVTVLNAAKLTDPELTKHIKDGDKILIYEKDKRIVIYRPSTDKLVDILTIDDQKGTDVLSESKAAASVSPDIPQPASGQH